MEFFPEGMRRFPERRKAKHFLPSFPFISFWAVWGGMISTPPNKSHQTPPSLIFAFDLWPCSSSTCSTSSSVCGKHSFASRIFIPSLQSPKNTFSTIVVQAANCLAAKNYLLLSLVFQLTKIFWIFVPCILVSLSPLLLPFLFEKCLLGTRTNGPISRIQPTNEEGGGDFSTTMAFSVVSCFPRGTKCFDFFSLKKKKKVFSYVWFCFSRGGIPFPLVNSRACLLLFYLRPFGGGRGGGHQQLPKLGARFPAKVKFAKKKDDLFLNPIVS